MIVSEVADRIESEIKNKLRNSGELNDERLEEEYENAYQSLQSPELRGFVDKSREEMRETQLKMEIDIRDVAIESIASAIVSASTICRREHVKADRTERVGHFVTCLRRVFALIQRKESWLVDSLCNKAIWYDIGFLGSMFSRHINLGASSYVDVNVKTIEEWVMYARLKADANKGDPIEEIEMQIDTLNSSLGYFRMRQQETNQLLKKADQLAEELADALTFEGV